MSLLRLGTWTDGRTGAVVPGVDEPLNGHAVAAGSHIYAPGASPRLEGLRAGVTLVIDTRVDLRAFRLDREPHRLEDASGYAYTHNELKAAFAHPDVTREHIVRGIEPPERGRRLALYETIARWIAYVEREWREPAPGEAMVGPAEAVLEPVLLDLYGECRVALSAQCKEWVEGTACRIPESAAREAERCLRAALDAYASALQRSLDDQLGAIGAREGVEHWFSIVATPHEPNALQCACRVLDSCYDPPCGHGVLWRPVVDLASSAERACIEIRPRNSDVGPVRIDIDSTSVGLLVGGGCTRRAHHGDSDRLHDIGETVADTVRATVTQTRKELPLREA